MKKTATKSYALRIDAPLVKPLQELKKQNRRSLNAEINAALEAWVVAAHSQATPPEVASSTKSSEGTRREATPKQPRSRKQPKRKSVEATAQAAETPEPAGTPELAVASEAPAAAS